MNKMKELVDFLNYHTKLYDEGKPQISDFEWDKKYFELQNMEAETGHVLPDSPTHRIKYEAVNELKKVTHSSPMLSADKTKDWNTFVNYFGGKDFITMLKLDGLTCRITYRGGRLVAAETRGNGLVGEDVRHNAHVIPSIPKIIDYNDELIVDGEIICTEKDFKPFSAEYKNPRNFASGSIRLLNPNKCKNRNLTFVVWNVVKGIDSNSFNEKLSIIDNLGFTIVPFSKENNKEQLIEIANALGFPIDGLVGRFDDITYGESLGATSHHQKAIYAFKMYDEEIETILTGIDWTMSRKGVLTPVAEISPVEIDGTTVERCNLHNLSVMNDTLGQPYIGQKVKVIKANCIIPVITWAEKIDNPNNEILMPEVCPICGESTIVTKSEDGTERLECSNTQCEGKLVNRIDHFFSKRGLDARGISKKTIEFLIDNEFVKELKDVFNLESVRSVWEAKLGYGRASVEKIINGIRESRNCTLESVISGAGIHLIGRTAAKELGKYFSSYQEFRDFVDTDDTYFDEFDGFGEEMNSSLKNFDYTELDYIVENYINFTKEEKQTEDESLIEGLTFCVTGKVTLWKNRSELQAYIEKCGGRVVGSMSAKVNYLINNDINSTSAKNKYAKDNNIPILTEQDFSDKFVVVE